MTAVECLDPLACGAFVIVVGEAEVGSVFVEANRVCWAAHVSLAKRLRDLLREHLGSCAKSEAMRRAIKQHTIESLLAMPQELGEQIIWVDRERSYDPRFSFTPVELLVGVNASLYRTEASGAELGLAMLDLETTAASFVPADDGGLIAVGTNGTISIAELDELASWADAAFGVTRGFPLEVVRRALDAASDEACIAWQTSRKLTHAAMLARGPARDRLVATIEGRRFPAVVSRRAFRSSLAVRDDLGTVDSNP
ncbi:MAG TPA: hypothetical protein VIU61_07450 [Kofleriaceae bacterium]